MKKFLFLFAVMMCVGLCSCTINVNGSTEKEYGKIKVIYELDSRYDWDRTRNDEVITRINIIDDDTDTIYDSYKDDIENGKGRSFKVRPGYYYVEISVYNYYYRGSYPYKTRVKHIKRGDEVRAVYNGDSIRFVN